MDRYTLLACCSLSLVSAHAQALLTYLTSDTVHVSCYRTDEWPYDTTCVALDVYDERISFSYPTTMEIRDADVKGALLTKHIVHADSLVTLRFYPNGQLKVKDVSNRGSSLAWLLNETYHPNGQLHAKWNVSTDTLGLLTTYYANGEREREYWYYAGRAFNDWTEWHETGQVKLEAHYERGPLTEQMKPFRPSLPIGEWRYYKANGDLEKVEVYEDGKLKETRLK